MANYVLNILKTKNEEDFQSLDKLLIKDNEVDFNKFIRMPDTLDIECSSNSFVIDKYRTGYQECLRLAVTFKKLYKSSKTIEEFVEDVLAIQGSLSKEEKDNLILKAQGFWNLKTYGSTDWYDWRIKHWGTKWNAGDTSISNGVVTFTTAWSTCLPVLAQLAQHIDFDLIFADEDWGVNCGLITARNGKVEIDANFGVGEDITNLEAQFIACLIWQDEDSASEIEGISDERKAYLMDCVAKYL